MRFVRLRRLLPGLKVLFFSCPFIASASADDSAAAPVLPVEAPDVLQKTSLTNAWSLQFGVAFITANNIGEILSGEVNDGDDTGGEAYSLSLNWVARRFQLSFREKLFQPQLEPYLTVTVGDETGESTFHDFNGGIGLRWVDFPWERWVRTSFFTGVGLSYSARVYAVDRQRHPDTHRSHLKIDWPLQVTFALPSMEQHQLVLFNDHQSGGHIFDEGGVNSLGIGYRWLF